MAKVCENFEAKLIEYGVAVKEYDAAHDAFRKNRSVLNERRVDAAGRQLDRLRGPMYTALGRLARAVV